MKNSIIIFITFLSFVVSSCDKQRSFMDKGDESVRNISIPVSNSMAPPERKVKIEPDRKIIKKGEIAFKTSDVSQTEQFIKQIAHESEGYISMDNIFVKDSSENHVLEIRMPSHHFETVLEAISSKAGTLDRKEISALDVTEDFVDTESRIKAKKQVEARYFDLLKQAKNVEEMMIVEAQLATIRVEIEAAEGHLQFVANRAAFSTLRITFYEPEQATPPVIAQNRFVKAFHNGWNYMVVFMLGLVNIWPFIIIISTVVYLLIRVERRNKANKKIAV